MSEHACKRHDARSAADEEDRTALVHRPQEVSSDRAAQLDLVTHGDGIVKERRYLTVIEPLDRELDRLADLRRRCDRVAALCFVAIGHSEPHIHVLPRNESQRLAQPEEEALDRRCARLDGDDRRGLPDELEGAGWFGWHGFTGRWGYLHERRQLRNSRVGEVTCQTSANQRPSPLVEPDVQISRIRLSCKRSPLMRPARLITPPAPAAES